MNWKVLFATMFLITDCDKTLVHYESNSNNNNNIIALPSSSGSNKIGYIHKQTISLLDDISKNNKIEAIICCSGMRTSTMYQRYSYLPSITYWITENGGRIHEIKRIDGSNHSSIEEITEWKDYLLSDDDNFQRLIQLQKDLINDGYDVDGIVLDNDCNKDSFEISISNNYSTMIRVKNSKNMDIMTIIPKISSSLKYSFNLGYLDIYLPNSGKLKSSLWLMKYIRRKKRLVDDEDQDQNEVIIARDDTNIDYYFMGDDDNDIEIANNSTKAFIVEPCSESMQQFVREKIHLNEVIVSNKLYHEATINLLQIMQGL